ncbi:hypothetical protein D3C75_538620 [compost metagenome]
MNLEKIQNVLVGLELNVSSIDEEYPRKFYVSIFSEKEHQIIIAVLNYFEHKKFSYSLVGDIIVEEGKVPNFEQVQGILIEHQG